MQDNTELFQPQELQSPFETIKETDSEGREWWNSRKLARLIGYQKYWNFERLINKVTPYMGLMTWKNAPDGRIIKSDVTVAKNYLSENEVTLFHFPQ